MTKNPTLTAIVDYGTIGGEHLAGEARFSDGKRYRFVIDAEWDFTVNPNRRKAPAVLSMARLTKDWRGNEQFNHNYQKPVIYPKRAALIMPAYPEYLAKAKVEKAEEDAAEETKRMTERDAYLREQALVKAAPDLLAALQDILPWAVEYSKTQRTLLHGIGDFQRIARAKTAIAKATTISA